jgi:hypothetical protein
LDLDGDGDGESLDCRKLGTRLKRSFWNILLPEAEGMLSRESMKAKIARLCKRSLIMADRIGGSGERRREISMWRYVKT